MDNNIELSDEELNKLVAERDIFYRQICSDHLEALPGVESLLVDLRQNNLKVGLATSTSRGNIEFFLPKLGIYDYFDQVSVQDRVKEHLEGKMNRRLFIWSLLNFEWWKKQFLPA